MQVLGQRTALGPVCRRRSTLGAEYHAGDTIFPFQAVQRDVGLRAATADGGRRPAIVPMPGIGTRARRGIGSGTGQCVWWLHMGADPIAATVTETGQTEAQVPEELSQTGCCSKAAVPVVDKQPINIAKRFIAITNKFVFNCTTLY